MSAMQRNKGKAGEREIAAIIADLTGWQVKRRVRQHDGDSDLEGVPGWSVEVKRHAKATRGDIAGWWRQAVSQSKCDGIPVLFYRVDRGEWRAVWPLCAALRGPNPVLWLEVEYTCDTTVLAWAAVAREVA